MTADNVFERLLALEQFGIKLGLDNIRALTAALHNPQDSYSCVHIAGTNGKGSVSAMIERALRDAGYRTGRYTSPHLERLEERVAIDGVAVDASLFRAAAADVLALVDDLRRQEVLATTPTFFEVTTAIAFEIFRRTAVQAAVIEVGLGGRFDATSVVTPAVSAITSIAFDHEKHLGNTLASIAFEKAGILKPGVTVVVGAVQSEASSVIEEVARRQNSPVVLADHRLLNQSVLSGGRATITVTTPTRRYENVRLALLGEHQVDNALVAIRTLEALRARGLEISDDNIVVGLTQVSWPARLEWLRLPDGRRVLIDAAHNVAGAEALARYLALSGGAPLPVVLAVMKDKNVDGIIAALTPVASRFVATRVASPRALPAAELRARIGEAVPHLPVAIVEAPIDAVDAATADERCAVAAGSIFLVGPLRGGLVARGAVSLQGS